MQSDNEQSQNEDSGSESEEENVNSTNNSVNNSTNNSNNNSTNNSHNNTTNVQNNYTVNMYGKENVSHITDAQLLKILNQGFKSVPAYISLKYFSDAMPENSNVCNTNINSPNILVFNGKKWLLIDYKY